VCERGRKHTPRQAQGLNVEDESMRTGDTYQDEDDEGEEACAGMTRERKRVRD